MSCSCVAENSRTGTLARLKETARFQIARMLPSWFTSTRRWAAGRQPHTKHHPITGGFATSERLEAISELRQAHPQGWAMGETPSRRRSERSPRVREPSHGNPYATGEEEIRGDGDWSP